MCICVRVSVYVFDMESIKSRYSLRSKSTSLQDANNQQSMSDGQVWRMRLYEGVSVQRKKSGLKEGEQDAGIIVSSIVVIAHNVFDGFPGRLPVGACCHL